MAKHPGDRPARTVKPRRPRLSLTIHTTKDHEQFARLIARRCRVPGISVRITKTPRIAFDDCVLQFGDPGALEDTFADLLRRLEPIEFSRHPDPSLAQSVHLWVSGPPDALAQPVIVRCPDRAAGEAFAKDLREAGFRDVDLEIVAGIAADEIIYRTAPVLARDAIGLLLCCAGASPVEFEVGSEREEDRRIVVNLLTPALARLSRSLVVEIDDPTATDDVVSAFHRAGFENVSLRVVNEGEIGQATLDPGGLEAAGCEGVIARVMAAAERVLPDDDSAGYPLRRRPARSGHVVVQLPIRGIRTRRLRPWDGPSLRRWPIVIRTDDHKYGRRLVAAMKDRGFEQVTKRWVRDGAASGFGVRGAGSGRYRVAAAEAAIDVLRTEMCGYPETRGMLISIDATTDDHIEVIAPFKTAISGMLGIELEDPGRFAVEIIAPEAEAERVRELAVAIGFRRIDVTHDIPEVDLVEYGAAGSGLVDTLRRQVLGRLGSPMPIAVRRWRESKPKIRISLTERPALRPAEAATPDSGPRSSETPKEMQSTRRWTMQGWGYAGPLEAVGARPIVKVEEDRVRIGRLNLPRKQPGHPDVPRAPRVFTIDPKTAAILIHLAESLMLGDHVLLEGDTGVSKTSTTDFFLRCVGLPRHRMNLSGQVDVQDLVGRYEPGEAGWHWHDGPVARALRNGTALVFDEINLAGPVVLDRLNSVLEDRPTLTVDEHLGERLEAASGFFAVATCNPLTYEGRQQIDEALGNRLVPLRVPRPDAADHAAYLRHCLVGETPAIVADGVVYAGSVEEPAYPELGRRKEMLELIAPLAEFQVAVEAAARHGAAKPDSADWSGSGNRAFSRRQLIKALRKVDQDARDGEVVQTAVERAIERYYCSGLTGTALEIVRDLAAAHGLVRLRHPA